VPNSKYEQQLQTYQNAIEAMGYTVVEKTLIYIGDEVVVVNF
jgi:hypothetical protein